MTIKMTIIITATTLYGLGRRAQLFFFFFFLQRPKVWLLGNQTKGQTRETDYGSGRTLNRNNQPQHAQRHMLILSRGKSIMRLQGIRKFGL